MPFSSWYMYEVGLIDEHGNFIVPADKRTDEQNSSYSYLDMLVYYYYLHLPDHFYLHEYLQACRQEACP